VLSWLLRLCFFVSRCLFFLLVFWDVPFPFLPAAPFLPSPRLLTDIAPLSCLLRQANSLVLAVPFCVFRIFSISSAMPLVYLFCFRFPGTFSRRI
jgi:hypothetical protein